MSFPFFESAPTSQERGDEHFLVATGIPVADGKNEAADTTLAARNALVNMIQLLCERGYSREQAYAICSVAVDLRLSEVVNLPNVLVTAHLPLSIFTS
jgi:formamidase